MMMVRMLVMVLRLMKHVDDDLNVIRKYWFFSWLWGPHLLVMGKGSTKQNINITDGLLAKSHKMMTIFLEIILTALIMFDDDRVDDDGVCLLKNI